jgi:hypothetical protein
MPVVRFSTCSVGATPFFVHFIKTDRTPTCSRSGP